MKKAQQDGYIILFIIVIALGILLYFDLASIGPGEYADIEVRTAEFQPNIEVGDQLVVPFSVMIYTGNWNYGIFKGRLFFYVDGAYQGTTEYTTNEAYMWVDEQGLTPIYNRFYYRKIYYDNKRDFVIPSSQLGPGEHILMIRLFQWKPDDYGDAQDDTSAYISWVSDCAVGDGDWNAEAVDRLYQCGLDYPASGTPMINEDDTEKILFTVFEEGDLPNPPLPNDCTYDADCPENFKCINNDCVYYPSGGTTPPAEMSLWQQIILWLNVNIFNKLGIEVK